MHLVETPAEFGIIADVLGDYCRIILGLEGELDGALSTHFM